MATTGRPHRLILWVSVLALAGAGGIMSPAVGDEKAKPPAEVPTENGASVEDHPRLRRVELATVGFDMLTQAPIVLLREPQSGDVVPIWVGMGEARAIAWALNGVEPPRPMTHDLAATLLRELSAELVDVIVDELVDNTFHGKLKLRVKGEEQLRTIDTRPSDGLALALRTGAEIHVADRIFEDTPKYDFLPPDESMQVVHALGVTVVKPNADHRRRFSLPERSGVVVTHVSGVAEKRGLRPGDLIVSVNDRTPTNPMDFFDAIRTVPPGRAIRILYVREGEEIDVELPAENVPVEPIETEPKPGTLRA